MLFGQEHVDRYVATGGEEGHEWQPGVYSLILWTTGRRSGERRAAPLIYDREGESYRVVASKGGSDAPPAWYLNLRENPDVEVQVLDDRFAARARVATPEEKPALWERLTKIWPAYDEYQQKTEREIPVVVLERA